MLQNTLTVLDNQVKVCASFICNTTYHVGNGQWHWHWHDYYYWIWNGKTGNVRYEAELHTSVCIDKNINEWLMMPGRRLDCRDRDKGCRVVVLVVAAGVTFPITFE